MTEAEFKKHLDAAEKSPKEIAAAVTGLSEKVLRNKPFPKNGACLKSSLTWRMSRSSIGRQSRIRFASDRLALLDRKGSGNANLAYYRAFRHFAQRAF